MTSVVGTNQAVDVPATNSRRKLWPWGMIWRRGLCLLIFVGICAVSWHEGIRLRRWVWDVTVPIRFGDINNGCRWGLLASGPEGYLNQYEKMAVEEPRWGIWLDYAPLRLLVMEKWGHWLRQTYPVVNRYSPRNLTEAWEPQYEFTEPVLKFNTAMDVLAVVCAFLLTRLWVIRGDRTPTHQFFRGAWQGLAAGLIVWFNPGMLLSAYGWPTWDAWIVPFFLLAVLLASYDCWLLAGIALGVGAMFKGQQLAVAPVFVLWALVLGKPGAILKWAAGLALAIGAIASPWLLSYIPPDHLRWIRNIQAHIFVQNYPAKLFVLPRVIDRPAILWVGSIFVAAIVLPLVARVGDLLRPRKALPLAAELALGADPANARRGYFLFLRIGWHIIAAAAAWMIVYRAWRLPNNTDVQWHGIVAALAMAIAVGLVGLRHIPALVCGATGAALLLCIMVFHGSTCWWDCGFHFGTIHWPTMIMGLSDNLPGILYKRFHWPEAADRWAFTLPAMGWHHLPHIFTAHGWWPVAPLDVTSKQMCTAIYVTTLLVCGIGAGLQARRRDPRFLVAITAPWLMFFCFPAQIHERYLLFAAGVAAICVGQSVGVALLGIFLSIVTTIMTIHVMLRNGDTDGFGIILNKQFPWLCSTASGETLLRYIDGTHPDMGWAVLLCAAIFMYLSLVPSPKGRLNDARV